MHVYIILGEAVLKNAIWKTQASMGLKNNPELDNIGAGCQMDLNKQCVQRSCVPELKVR
jgi:predicted transcriptional regulator